jgi:hypothetical protein
MSATNRQKSTPHSIWFWVRSADDLLEVAAVVVGGGGGVRGAVGVRAQAFASADFE